ncbi:MAG: hypothetical protein AAF989_08385, partial [Planctomycetota bacterium]
PSTDDADVIDQMLQALDPTVMPNEGDTLDEAISLAIQQIDQGSRGGSILVVSDGVNEKTIASVANLATSLPSIQIFAPLRTEQDLDASGVNEVAAAISAKVQRISADDRDIENIIDRADRQISDAIDRDATAWRDDGYWLIPALAIVCLAWSRRGWSLG